MRRTALCALLLLAWLGSPPSHGQNVSAGPVLGSEAAARGEAKRFLAGRGVGGAAQSMPVARAEARRRASAAQAALMNARPADNANLAAAWQPLGPATVNTSLYGEVTGRITAVAPDPNDPTGNTVWLGTTGGGVWKSTNAAGALQSVRFAPLTDTLPVFSGNAGTSVLPALSIGAVAVQPAANPVVLAGTGDPNDSTDSYYGEGILRSADGGQTWTLATGSKDGVNGNHSFAGLATAGLAWSTATPSLVVAAMSSSAEGDIVGAVSTGAVPGLYFSADGGSTWQMASVFDGAQIVQAPSSLGTAQVGAPATAVVWDAKRSLFFAAVQFHGYYSSPDGQTWTRLAHQPGLGLTVANCPAGINGLGSQSCPILRGTLAVQPMTGDLYALTVDANDNDQGLWQDLCNAGSSGSCASTAPVFATRLDGGALEVGQGAGGSSTVIPQGSYDLALAAAPAANSGTVLFAGTIDLYRCALGAGASACTFRNTTNAGNACNATATVAPAEHALAAVAQSSGAPLLFLGNDGGLWRSLDGVAETGPVCAPTDAGHFDNLNTAIGAGGSLAEVVGFAQDPSAANTLIAGLGQAGTAATSNASALGSWPQLSAGEGGFPLIDANTPQNWYLSTGAGVNLSACVAGLSCTAQDLLGSATIGAVQTGDDAALLAAPVLLDPQNTSSVLTATCRVWRGPAQSGASWVGGANALSATMDGSGTPCAITSAFIRSLGAGGPAVTTSSVANSGSQVIYAGMAGAEDGGGTLPGHLFVTRSANTTSGSTAWTDVSGGAVLNGRANFNASGFDISSIAVDPHDGTGATVYATVMGFGIGPHVYRSTDFGGHWTSLSANLPDAPANSIVVDPDDANTVYVALDTGVYVTQAVTTCASANCWSVLGSGLPNSPITELQAGADVPTNDGRVGMLRAGSYGRGLWEIPLLTAHTLLQPAMLVTPSALSFGSQSQGTQSAAQAITVTNNGQAQLVITTISIGGSFVETDTCAGQTVAIGGTCMVSVRFAPTATGALSGLLTIYANVPGGQATVSLSGTGTAQAAVVLTPLQLTFGSTLVNQTAAAQIVTVSNTGGSAVVLQAPTVTGDFAIQANTCGANLASQTGCSIAITFTPTASGTRTGVLTVSDSVGTQTAQLTGTGESPATDTLSPVSLTFPQQQVGSRSAPQQVTLTNAGDVPLTLITAAVTQGDFAATNACGNSLAAHSTCAISVVFAPTATGTRSGSLQITDEFRTQSVSLAGYAVAPAGVSLSPSAVSFGPMGVGLNSPTTTVTLTNNGGLPLALTSPGLAGDFVMAANSCGSSLAVGGSCTFDLLFAPTAPGLRTGALTLGDNAPGGRQTVTLTGTGIDFGLAPDGPTSVSVSSGTSATFPLLLSSTAGLSGSVALSCAGAPANAVCTVNPSTAALGGTQVITATLQTGVSTSSSLNGSRLWRHGRGEGITLAGLPFLWLAVRRRTRVVAAFGRAVPLVMLVVLAAALLGISGCGASRMIPLSGTGGAGGGASQPTSPGSYALTVTGVAAGVSHSVNLTLVVQ